METIDDVVKRICTDGHSYVMTTVITNIDCQERTGRNGKSYLNAFVTIASPVKGAQSMPDGTHRMGMLGAVQMPFNQILLVMRKDKFYGRFVNYIGEAAEAGFASMYLTGVAVKFFASLYLLVYKTVIHLLVKIIFTMLWIMTDMYIIL